MYTGILITDDAQLALQIHEICRLIPVTLTHIVTFEEIDQDSYVDVIFWGYYELSLEQFKTLKRLGACIFHFIHRSIVKARKLTSPANFDLQIRPHQYEHYPIAPQNYAAIAEEYQLIIDRYAR